MTIFSITQNIDSKFSVENLQFSWSIGIQIFTRKHSGRCVPPAFVVPGKWGRVSQGVRYPRGRVYPPRKDMESYIPYPRRNMGPEIPYPPWQDMGPGIRKGPGTYLPWTDTHLWKHYLSATSLAGGNNTTLFLGFAAIKCIKKDDNCRWDRQIWWVWMLRKSTIQSLRSTKFGPVQWWWSVPSNEHHY